jgi:hypothetical protein
MPLASKARVGGGSLRRFRSIPGTLRRASAAVTLLVLVSSLATRAASQPPEGTAAPESLESPPLQPEALPSREELERDPAATGLMLFDLLEQAEKAEKEGDARRAIRNYEAIARAVPERATAFSKLCEMHQSIGDRQAAIAACFRATGLPGTKVSDQLRYAELLLAKPPGQDFMDADIRELRATFQHLRNAGVQSVQLETLECQFAVVLEDLDAMRTCVARLRTTLPAQSPITLTYEMSLALFERDFGRARALIAEAPVRGMGPESIALMERELESREHARSPGVKGSVGSSALPLAGLMAGAIAVLVLAIFGWRVLRRPKAA